MRNSFFRACVVAAVVASLASCAQQPTRPTPAPAADEGKRPAASPTSAPTPPKPKPKPKPTAPTPKPENDTDVTPAPAPPPPPAVEGMDRSQVGYYFDTLQGRLRQSGDPSILVTRTDGHITVDITERVHFQSADASLPAADCAALAPIAKALVEYKMTRVVADVGVDGSDSNQAKSRAGAITKCLSDAGVAGRRLSVRDVAAPGARTVLRIEPIVK